MRGAIIPSTQEDTSSEHHLWFSPGGYNWLANNNDNTSLWNGKPLPGKTPTILSHTSHLCHVTKVLRVL